MSKIGFPFKFAENGYGPEHYRSIGTDLILCRNSRIIDFSTEPFISEHFILLVCVSGKAVGNINLVRHEITYPEILVVRPDQLLQFESFSDDFVGFFVLASKDYLKKMDLRVTEVLPVAFLSRLFQNPLITLSKKDLRDAVMFFNFIFEIMNDEDNPFRDLAVVNMLRAFLFEAGFYLSKNMDVAVSTPRQDPILEQLLALIQENFHEHKDSAFYAEKMNLTQNYLYKVIKKVTNKTVSDWIEQYTITEAKSLLRDDSLSIDDVSKQMNFPSQSFFGKYFKRVVGMSPNAYRKTLFMVSPKSKLKP